MKIEIEGSRGNVYTVDTEEVSCTCADYRFRCCRAPITSEARQCKHLRSVYSEHPEYMPGIVARAMKELDSKIEAVTNNSKIKYTRSLVESYYSYYKSELELSGIKSLKVIGDFAKGEQDCSELIFLIKETENNYLQTIENCTELFGGEIVEKKESVIDIMVDGFFPIKFIICSEETYIPKYFFGSNDHGEISRVLDRAWFLGYNFSDEGLINQDGLPVKLFSIDQLYKQLDLQRL